jgi:Neuraminidase (sialidase)
MLTNVYYSTDNGKTWELWGSVDRDDELQILIGDCQKRNPNCQLKLTKSYRN